jgi:putative endonuclease
VKLYNVYILASRTRVLYTGITGDLETRLAWHRSFANPKCFTAQYKVTRLVHVEEYSEVTTAIAREKEIKGWRRAKKIRLIEATNPEWEDLAPN